MSLVTNPHSSVVETRRQELSLEFRSSPGSSFVIFLGKTTPHKANFKFLLGGFFQVASHPPQLFRPSHTSSNRLFRTGCFQVFANLVTELSENISTFNVSYQLIQCFI